MTKLQRYRNVLESEMYFASETDAVIEEIKETYRRNLDQAHMLAAELLAEIGGLKGTISEWEAKEKALRELANEWASFSWAPFMNPAARLKAILSREQEKHE